MPELVVEGLGVDYGTDSALHEVSFTVADGEFLTLVGPSGCGKTTTLMTIAGLVKPSRGTIRCGDRVFADAHSKKALAPEDRDCGVVFQSYAVWPHMTVRGNVHFPLKLRKVSRAEARKQVNVALDLVEMGEYADRYPHQLSGGQQQRVALARALVYSPGVLLLDEPLSNLDAKLRLQARTWLKRLQERVGVTTVFVTHDQDEALAMSDRVVVMNFGAIEQIGTPEQIYQEPDSPFVAGFIGSSNILFGSVVEAGARTLVKIVETGWILEVSPVEPLAVGTDVTVAIRPELAMLLPDDAAAEQSQVNTYRATILANTYRGARYECVIDASGVELRVSRDLPWASADALVQLPARACRVFAKVTSK